MRTDADLRRFWARPDAWPLGVGDWVFLAAALTEIGRASDAQWTGSDLAHVAEPWNTDALGLKLERLFSQACADGELVTGFRWGRDGLIYRLEPERWSIERGERWRRLSTCTINALGPGPWPQKSALSPLYVSRRSLDAFMASRRSVTAPTATAGYMDANRLAAAASALVSRSEAVNHRGLARMLATAELGPSPNPETYRKKVDAIRKQIAPKLDGGDLRRLAEGAASKGPP